jgi:DNA-binding IclR family transcriptional regulator
MRQKPEREPCVACALRVLHLLAERDGARLRDIAAELYVPQSTVYPLLSALEETGYVVRPPGVDHPPYLPGRAVFDVISATREETQERGYAVNPGETEPDFPAVADMMGRVGGALSVAGPSCRTRPARSPVHWRRHPRGCWVLVIG